MRNFWLLLDFYVMSLIFFKENISRYTHTLTYPVRNDLRLCVKDISNFYTLREGHWPHSMQKYLTFQNFVFKTSKLTCSKSTYQGIYKNRIKSKRKSFEIPVYKEIQFQSEEIQDDMYFLSSPECLHFQWIQIKLSYSSPYSYAYPGTDMCKLSKAASEMTDFMASVKDYR